MINQHYNKRYYNMKISCRQKKKIIRKLGTKGVRLTWREWRYVENLEYWLLLGK